MKPTFILLSILLLGFLGRAQDAPSARYKPIRLDSNYKHTKWGILPADILYEFAAFTTSFDSDDDNNGDTEKDIWGIPEWVAYEIKRDTRDDIVNHKRPSKWMTDSDLHEQNIAPNDETYKVSGTGDLKVVKTDYRYVRGHMCAKSTAERISGDAGYNTHTVLNCVPQLQWQNNGIWKSLEQKCEGWADDHGKIWVVCGPIFFGNNPAVWLGQNGNTAAAVPDALFKIIIRESETSETGIETLAFIIPNVIPKEKNVLAEFLTTIEFVESATRLSFLTELEDTLQLVEKAKHTQLDISERQLVLSNWDK